MFGHERQLVTCTSETQLTPALHWRDPPPIRHTASILLRILENRRKKGFMFFPVIYSLINFPVSKIQKFITSKSFYFKKNAYWWYVLCCILLYVQGMLQFKHNKTMPRVPGPGAGQQTLNQTFSFVKINTVTYCPNCFSNMEMGPFQTLITLGQMRRKLFKQDTSQAVGWTVQPLLFWGPKSCLARLEKNSSPSLSSSILHPLAPL